MVDKKKKAAQKALAKGASIRETAAATGLSKSTVHRQAMKAKDKALTDPVLAPLPKALTPQAAALAGAVAAGQKVSSAKRAKRA